MQNTYIMDLHTPPTASLRVVRGLRWVKVSVMVGLDTKVQKLTGNEIILGNINYETEQLTEGAAQV